MGNIYTIGNIILLLEGNCMEKKTIRDIDVFEKKVLLRVDFNVPMEDGEITDDTRIKEALPTIDFLLGQGASLILMSHMGRPDGEFNEKYSLKPVAKRLQELMSDVNVILANDVVGEDAISKAKDLKKGDVLLLENLRFEKGEELNDKEFSTKLASLGDVYVNDAFGTAHRKHSSTYGVAMLKPNAIGFLIEKELKMISGTIANPKRPMTAILGGAKVKDKLPIVESLVKTANTIILGGGMAYTFLKAKGYNIGNSLCDNEQIEYCKNVLKAAEEKGVEILLPSDVVMANTIEDKEGELLSEINIPENKMGVDIGKKTIKTFVKKIKKSKTVIWNGPMGVFENSAFSNGTFKVAKAVAKSRCVSIIGGGDSVAALTQMKLDKKVSHISTGGGASMKLFEGKVLPAVDIIENKII